MARKILNVIMVIIFAIMFFFLATPIGTPLVDKIEPHILGLPCYQAWILYGALFMSAMMIVWFLLESKFEDKEIEEAEKKEAGSDE